MLESYKDRLLHEPKLTGIVQVDETLLGKNINHKRKGKTSHMQWIVGFRSLAKPDQYRYSITDVRDTETLLKILKMHVETGTKDTVINVDGWRAYAPACRLAGVRYNKQIGFTKGKNTRAGIEGLWGQLKTALRRTYNTAISCNPSIENTLSMAVEADWRIRNHRKTSFERAKSLIQWTTVEDDDCRTAME